MKERKEEPVQIAELVDVDAHEDDSDETSTEGPSFYRESLFLMDDDWHKTVNAKSPRD